MLVLCRRGGMLVQLRAVAPKFADQGLSLVEIVLVSLLSSIVLMAAARIAVSETRASIKSYAIQSLRDKYAKITYFIEGEVGEGDALSVARDTTVCPADKTPAAPSGVTESVRFLFSLRHRYVQSQGRLDKYTCFFGVPLVNTPGSDPNNWALYRWGPAIGDKSGVIGQTTDDSTVDSGLNPGHYVVSLYAYVYDVALNSKLACGTTGLPGVDAADPTKYACDGRTLTYRLLVGSGTSGRGSLWSSTYPSGSPILTVYARSRIL